MPFVQTKGSSMFFAFISFNLIAICHIEATNHVLTYAFQHSHHLPLIDRGYRFMETVEMSSKTVGVEKRIQISEL